MNNDLIEINNLYRKIQDTLKATGKSPIIFASQDQLNKLNESEFLNSNDRCNSKTYYYLRLIVEHPTYGLITFSEDHKKQLINDYNNICYKLRRKPKEYPMILNIKNGKDQHRYKNTKKQKWIADNEVVIDYFNEGYLTKMHLLTDDEIRDIILTDMALGFYDYE